MNPQNIGHWIPRFKDRDSLPKRIGLAQPQPLGSTCICICYAPERTTPRKVREIGGRSLVNADEADEAIEALRVQNPQQGSVSLLDFKAYDWSLVFEETRGILGALFVTLNNEIAIVAHSATTTW